MSWQASKQDMAFDLEIRAWKLYCKENRTLLSIKNFRKLPFLIYHTYIKKAIEEQ